MDALPDWISAIPLLPALFVGTFLLGETVVLAGIVLATAGVVSAPVLVGIALLGTLASDLVWFYFGQRIIRWARRWRWVEEGHDRAMATLQQVGDRGGFYYLLFFKFVYGIRIVTIVYTSLRRIRLRRFLLLDAAGSLAYLVVFVGAGLLLCRGASELAGDMHALRYLFAAPVLLFVLMRMGTQWLRKRLFDT
jgi:membrane protein DedA with SNARE-associated domain